MKHSLKGLPKKNKPENNTINNKFGEEYCSDKYLNIIQKNPKLAKLMNTFINDPTFQMKSVTESYILHSSRVNLPKSNFQSQISNQYFI